MIIRKYKVYDKNAGQFTAVGVANIHPNGEVLFSGGVELDKKGVTDPIWVSEDTSTTKIETTKNGFVSDYGKPLPKNKTVSDRYAKDE